MKCNNCFVVLNNGDGRCYATICNHVFCTTCAQRHFTKSVQCLICNQSLPQDGIAVLDFVNRPSQFVLFGCNTETCLEYSRMAIEFYVVQTNYIQIEHGENEKNILREKVKQSELQVKEIQFQYEVLRRHNEQLEAEKDQYKTELQMLTERYNNKSQQKRKLEELYSSVKFNNAVEGQVPQRQSLLSSTTRIPSPLNNGLNRVQQQTFKLSDEPQAQPPSDRFALLRKLKSNQILKSSPIGNITPVQTITTPPMSIQKTFVPTQIQTNSVFGRVRPQRPSTPLLQRRNNVSKSLLGSC